MTPARAARVLERDGVVVWDGLFPKPLLARARAEVLRREASGELARRGVVRDIAGRRTSVLRFSGPFLSPAFYANPRLASAAGAVLGAHWAISSLEVVWARPGATRQYHHIDAPLRFDRLVGGARRGSTVDLSLLPPYALAVATPLCAVDDENGPTAIWPGSHRRGLRDPLPSEREIRRDFPEARMTGPFGRSYLYDYRTFHLGLPNFSREPRPLLMLVLARTWFRDPNLLDLGGGVDLSPRDLARVPARGRGLFALARR